MEKYVHSRLIVLFLILTVKCQAQSYDSLKQRLLKLEAAQEGIKLNLTKHQNEFSVGTSLIISGIALGVADFLLRSKPSDYTFTIASSIIVTAGVVIQIDSHKFIGRAGRRKKS